MNMKITNFLKSCACNANISLAIVFASLMIAIALMTTSTENSGFITMLLILGYFASERIVKKASDKAGLN